MPQEQLVVRGAREHNLKNVTVAMPRDRLVVITGLSGSGKSSLAFDTIYAEGQRRYVESLSAYARQFLGEMQKPDVDQIDGLSPAISIDQKGASRNPRSTVGTVTEIYDHLRLLFARIGHPHCPTCGREIRRQSVQQIVDQIYEQPEGTRLMVLGPVIKDRKTEGDRVFDQIRRQGFARVRVDGEMMDLTDTRPLDKYKRHSIEVVVDRFVVERGEVPPGALTDDHGRPLDPETGAPIRPPDAARLADSVETALRLGEGVVLVAPVPRDGEQPAFDERRYSERYSCPYDGTTVDEMEPRSFSFNSPHGACPACTGLGSRPEIDPERVVPNRNLSLAGGALAPWSRMPMDASWHGKIVEAVCREHGWDYSAPVKDLPPEALDYILFARRGERVVIGYRHERGENTYSATFEGIVLNLERRFRETDSDFVKAELERYMVSRPCPVCEGKRLKPEILAVTRGRAEHLGRLHAFDHGRLRVGVGPAGPPYRARAHDRPAGAEGDFIAAGLPSGCRAGLPDARSDEPDALGRRSPANPAGDPDRLEPDGRALHPGRAFNRPAPARQRQADRDPHAAARPGQHRPGGGARRGDDPHRGLGDRHRARGRASTVARSWPPDRWRPSWRSRDPSPAPICAASCRCRSQSVRRPGSGQSIVLRGAREHNLKHLDVAFPLGCFVAVTGVSGSGKSTLVSDILYLALARELSGGRERPGAHDAIEGLEAIDKVIDIDQSPIGRTPRSNPATYTGLFAPIRDLFAATPESRVRGYMPGRFSFNVKGGRCEHCKGDGILKIEMQFLPDVYVPCEICKGKRYNREALEIQYQGRSIADVLEMTIEEALEFFSAVPSVRAKLQTLNDVGLGYVHLGQPATTLSGGEAQRVKLSTELSKRATGRTLYVLDEPTTGLHMADVEKLLQVLHRLVDAGNTVVVIEHNLDVVKTADWIVDLGPEGGERGGYVIAEGTPEEVARTPGSATGEYLARVLRGEPLVPLSNITFADLAGRGDSRRPAASPPIQAPGKRARAAVAGGERQD